MPKRWRGQMLYSHYTFSQLEDRINQFANRLQSQGVNSGDRVLLFVKPSLDFSALCFALFKLGAVVVLIDPGMGVKKLLNAVEESQAKYLIGIPLVHYIRRLFPKKFITIQKYFSTGSTLGAINIVKNIEIEATTFVEHPAADTETAAILFTSGGTGRPKGVVYTHGIFIAQTQMLQKEFSLVDSDLDIPGFPLFALFTLAMGMTSCIPLMNPAKPGKANPSWLIKNICDQGATFVAGSPAIWEKVADYCLQNEIVLASVKYLVMFGAPIPLDLHKKFVNILPNGTTYTPYGATECLPISNISGREILNLHAPHMLDGYGTCVGKPLESVEVKIIESSENVLESMSMINELMTGEVGEIIVKSPTVTHAYFALPEKTLEAKIYDGTEVWHRMGDMGYLDSEGRIWFCGRKAHVVRAGAKGHYPIQVESIFNRHPQVRRTALIGLRVGNRIEPAIVIEPKNGVHLNRLLKRAIISELSELAKNFEHTNQIHHFFFHKHFPVDVRHNIKIDRKKLAELAGSGRLQ